LDASLRWVRVGAASKDRPVLEEDPVHDQIDHSRRHGARLVGVPALAVADPSCVAQATDKKLAGAAKTNFANKCVADATGE
jgi:hypothetical protein